MWFEEGRKIWHKKCSLRAGGATTDFGKVWRMKCVRKYLRFQRKDAVVVLVRVLQRVFGDSLCTFGVTKNKILDQNSFCHETQLQLSYAPCFVSLHWETIDLPPCKQIFIVWKKSTAEFETQYFFIFPKLTVLRASHSWRTCGFAINEHAHWPHSTKIDNFQFVGIPQHLEAHYPTEQIK